MNDSDRHHEEQEPDAPEKLLAAFRDLPREQPFIPPYIDRTILKAAQEHLGKANAPRRGLRSWLLWPALAAACVFVAWIVHVTGPDVGDSTPAYAREDINRDGQIDVLDAFTLARQIEASSAGAEAADLNGDGLVDRRDAEFIAAEAVKLEKGGRS